MLRTHWIAAAAALTTAVLPAGSGAVQSAQPPQAPGGQGVMCAVMLYGVVAEIGRRCHPDRLPAFQAELRQSIATLDAYVLANSNMTPERLARIRAEQAGGDLPDDELCSADSFSAIYTQPDVDEGAEVAKMRAEIAAMTARPGTPTWEPCV